MIDMFPYVTAGIDMFTSLPLTGMSLQAQEAAGKQQVRIHKDVKRIRAVHSLSNPCCSSLKLYLNQWGAAKVI